MKIKHIAFVVAVAAGMSAPLAQAEKVRAENHHAFRNFSTDVTRTTGNGKTMNRHTEQVREQNQIRRETQVTTGEGKSASREVEGSYDPETHTYRKTIQATHMNGDNTSGERVTQRTENGYQRQLTHQNANGETASKQVDVDVDRENKTLTKTVTATGYNGETHTATVVKTYGVNEAE